MQLHNGAPGLRMLEPRRLLGGVPTRLGIFTPSPGPRLLAPERRCYLFSTPARGACDCSPGGRCFTENPAQGHQCTLPIAPLYVVSHVSR